MKKILLIEDNDEIRENTAEILELANYKVVTAANGKLGIETALAEVPDLIVCDIMMPVLDGYGVLHALHKNDSVKNIPFIFLTAKTERGDLRKGMELGADDYITKPFSGTELLNAIEGRLKKADLIKEEFSGLDGVNKLLAAAGSKDILESLTTDRDVNKYRKKQTVYNEGNRAARLFFIVKGKVKTFKSNDDGKELVVGLYTEGDFLGYVALLEGSSYKETAEAMEDSELAIIPKADFDELMNINPQVAQKFIQLLAKNVADKEEHLLGLAYNSLRKKVADALMSLQRKYKTGDGHFSINISRENLASIAGTATESLIRTLGDFRTEKLIDIKEGNIIILNEKKLENLLN
ncbi:MAG: response regulator [Chitinophagaceae bacterium]|nr:response regulator [Chitinophagaceae bacterium]